MLEIFFVRLRECARSIYTDFRVIIVTFSFLILIVAILYPQHLLTSATNIGPSSILGVIRYDPLVYIPLLALTCFSIFSFIKTRSLKISDSIISISIWIIFSIISAILLNTIFASAEPQKVISWSNTLMDADLRLFGVYPGFWLHQHLPAIFERIVIYTYIYLPTIISLWVVFLLIYKKGIFYKDFIHRMFLAFALCFPIWILLPAISPAQMYISNTLKQPIPASVSEVLVNGPPSSFTDQHIATLVRKWTDASQKRLAISTFPSMHTIWGIIFAYSVITVMPRKKYIWSIMAIMAILITGANMLGAMYLLQHFAVDILAGIALAILIQKIKR